MRVLSIGFPLPDPQVDNYNFISAPSFFDFDALVVDPAAVSQVIEDVVEQREERLTYVDEPVANGPTTATAVGLADLLHRRQEETSRLLARGALVVCFAHPDVPHPRVAGFTGCHRYYWLPAPPGLSYGPPHLMPGQGTGVQPVEMDHPFAAFVSQQRAHILYRAYFTGDAPAFAASARVFARSEGGAAVGVEMRCGGGRVVFLPALRPVAAGQERYKLTALLLDCVRRSLDAASRGPAPPWAGAVEVPALRDLRTAEEEAAVLLSEAEAAIAGARAARQERERWLHLLWQEGKLALEAVVREAFRLLGFQVTADIDKPAELTAEGTADRLLLEVEGSLEAVDLAPHYRLRRRMEEALETRAEAPRGLIVVNGYRLQAPEGRPQQFTDSLRVAAESMRYGLRTTVQLFEAVRAALAGDESAVAAFRGRLLTQQDIGQRA